MTAANAPCRARALKSMAEFWARPPSAEAAANPMQAHDEHALAAEVVGDAPAQQQEAGEGQRVRREHPLAVGRRDVQGPLRRGQGDDDDGGVEHHHQLGDGDDAEGAEALGVTPATVLSPAAAAPGSGGRGSRSLGSPVSWWSVVLWSFGSSPDPAPPTPFPCHLERLDSAPGTAYNRNRSSGSI